MSFYLDFDTSLLQSNSILVHNELIKSIFFTVAYTQNSNIFLLKTGEFDV